MAGDMLAQVADLLEETLQVHKAVKNAVLCTREGVVVAAVSKHEDIDPRLLATVSAALAWAGNSALGHIDQSTPSHLIHSTRIENILTILQPHYQLVVVVTRGNDLSFDVSKHLPELQSLATRIELLMSSHSEFSKETLLGNIVEAIPEITQVMLLTLDGLPLGSVGFDDEVEIAGLIGSIFANGLTFSDSTEYIFVNSEKTDFLVYQVDEKRLLAVVCHGPHPDDLARKVLDLVEQIV